VEIRLASTLAPPAKSGRGLSQSKTQAMAMLLR
jgi:hypothetical protein